MATSTYRFTFDAAVPLTDAEMTLHLALYAVEGLFGQARVRLDSAYDLDRSANAIVVHGGSEVGEALSKIFAGLAMREFGEHAFEVRPRGAQTPVATEAAA